MYGPRILKYDCTPFAAFKMIFSPLQTSIKIILRAKKMLQNLLHVPSITIPIMPFCMGNGLFLHVSCHFAWEMGYSYHAILHGKWVIMPFCMGNGLFLSCHFAWEIG
jgi:hypothetical protein